MVGFWCSAWESAPKAQGRSSHRPWPGFNPAPPAGEANTEFLRETAQGEFDDLVSAPRMVLEQYVRTQVRKRAWGSEQGCALPPDKGVDLQVGQRAGRWRRAAPAPGLWHPNRTCLGPVPEPVSPVVAVSRLQFPLDSGGADRGELDSLEYQASG